MERISGTLFWHLHAKRTKLEKVENRFFHAFLNVYCFSTDQCYKYYEENLSWNVAKTRCLSEGATLMTINAPEEMVSWHT